jgi:hypothetical protein
MTIKELYEWALENNVENETLWTDYGEGLTKVEKPTIEKFGIEI